MPNSHFAQCNFETRRSYRTGESLGDLPLFFGRQFAGNYFVSVFSRRTLCCARSSPVR